MNEVITKIKDKKFLTVFFVALFAIIAIPLTMLQLQKSQQGRSNASGQPVAIILSPLTKTVAVNDPVDIQVRVLSGQIDVSAIDITFSYDSSKLSLKPSNLDCTTTNPDCNATFSPSQSFTTILDEQINPGTIHYVGVNPTATKLNTSADNGLLLGTLHFVAKAEGAANVGFPSSPHVNAAGVDGPLPIDTTNTKPGTYTITAATISTTPVTSPIACNITEAGASPCPTGFQCQLTDSSSCTASVAGSCSGKCMPITETITTVPSVTPSGTAVTLYLSIPGIGSSSVAGLNSNPTRPTRSAYISFYNSQDQQVATASGNVNFQPTTGLYVGTIPVSVSDGPYTVKVAMDNTLWKRLSGIVNISSGQNSQTQPATLIPGDFNGDNEINLVDYTMMVSQFRHRQQ